MSDVLRLRQSIAKRLLETCPAQVRWELTHPEERKATRAMDLGSLVDQLVFGGSNYHEIDADSFRTKKAQQERDGATARGQVPVLTGDVEPARALAGAIRAKLLELGCELEWCDKQLTIQWVSPLSIQDPDLGTFRVACEGTPDMAFFRPDTTTEPPESVSGEEVTIDLKVGGNGNPDALAAHAYDQGWDIQAAAYQEGRRMQHLYPERIRGQHYLLHAQVGGACIVQAHPFGESLMELGRARWEKAQRIWQRCVVSDEWPEYTETVLQAPTWAYRKLQQESI